MSDPQKELPLSLPVDLRSFKLGFFFGVIFCAMLSGGVGYGYYQQQKANSIASANKLAADMADKCIASDPKEWSINAGNYLGPKVNCVRK